MNTYRYRVVLEVEVPAFDQADAWEMLQDAFGIGENCGTNVTECEYKEVNV